MRDAFRLALARLVAVLLRAQSRPYPFPAGTALVVAPHAGDESLGCGGLIAAKVRRGDPVHVALVSDSAVARPAPGHLASHEVAARRRGEALAALRELGLQENCVHFFNAPDGRLSRLDYAETEKLQVQLAALLRALRPAEIFMPYLGGGSTEHDAAVWLVREAIAVARQQPVAWEYPVWAWWNPLRLRRQLAHGEENFHLELGPLRAVKIAALARHESQMRPAGPPALPAELAEACTGPVEFYFRRPG